MIQYALFTDPGSREINEDAIGAAEQDGKYCFVLCDGLGGHGMGDIASGLVRDVFVEQFRNTDKTDGFIGHTFLDAQQALLAEQKHLHAEQKMKTTGVVLVTDSKSAYIGHVGDSRVYVFKHNKVKCRTLDHSIPQMLVLTREIKESEIRNHPQRNLVLRVLGIEWEEPQYELMNPLPLNKCQAFLLCSDGFWELIDEKQMCETLKQSGSPEEWVETMAKIVRENGIGRKMDNFSAIAVWNTK